MLHERPCISARVLAPLLVFRCCVSFAGPILVLSSPEQRPRCTRHCIVCSSRALPTIAPSVDMPPLPRWVQDQLYWLLGTSVQEKTDLACPITIIPGHGTRLRDKGNLFFSLSERGKLHQARTTDPFWQHALRKTIWMPSERSSFEGIWTNDDGTLAQLDPLMHGRLRWILFTPPFGSHGAVRPRSE
jgi:hypothetical protein